MKGRNKNAVNGSVALFASFLWLVSSPGETATIKITCGAKETIGNSLKKLKPGDTLLVSGACSENVVISPELNGVTLDGQGKAIINGPDTTSDAITVLGREITIKGFTVAGGQDGISVIRGAAAIVDGNTVQNTGRYGINLALNSFARIINNTIQNNPSAGIQVAGSSFAWIGFLIRADKTPRTNIVQNNGGVGILVERSSSARLVGNAIRGNKGGGVRVQAVSHGEISSNTIDGNGRDGIAVIGNSGVFLGREKGTDMFSMPNTTTAPNTGFGIRCALGGYAHGRLGTLSGTSGAKEFPANCIDELM
ncbi:MAG: right-handed parallel beta-helix repeat-containing protein [Deltaproteobacteria bacterium]|nr:right-handed parallel beta-helix repeat-containing protein [Deltaproteobacteria bacterium]